MRRIGAGREGGRESGASEEDIKAAFIIHVGAGGRIPHPSPSTPPSNFLALFHLKLHFFISCPRLRALPVSLCAAAQLESPLLFCFFLHVA